MIKLEGYDGGDVCIPNIGPKERQKRMMFGIATLIAAALVALFLIFIGWAWWTRFLVFLFLVPGFSGIFQEREKT